MRRSDLGDVRERMNASRFDRRLPRTAAEREVGERGMMSPAA